MHSKTLTHLHRQLILCAVYLYPATTMIGCVDKSKELEPRPDVRPMINEIEQAEQDWNWISAQQWKLTQISNSVPIEGSLVTLEFKEHTWLEGNSGCNRYTAHYERKAESGLKISEIISTRMFCAQPNGVMQQESNFLNLLHGVDSYHATPEELSLFSDGSIVLLFETYESPNYSSYLEDEDSDHPTDP